MKKKILALVLAAVMIFALCACDVSTTSSSTTSVSTSVTDAEGNTTTQTVTNEVGVSSGPDGVQTTNETTTDTTTTPAAASMADLYPPIEEWYDTYVEGAEGETESGEKVYYAVNDPESASYAMLLFQSPDGSVSVRDGELSWNEEEGFFVLYDAEMDVSIPFTAEEKDEESFVMTFVVDGSSVDMYFVDQDTIITDIHGILSNAVSSAPAAEENAA